jgi:hypothetical protein
MPDYRAYFVRADGHFAGVNEIYCANDQEALERARQIADRSDIELWARGRFIAKIEREKRAAG